MNETGLQVIESGNTLDLAVARDPALVLAEAQKAASALQAVISKKHKPVVFNGEQYLEFEDWQTVGRFYGVCAKVLDTHPVEIAGATGFEARAVVIRVSTGEEISAADAMCLNDEKNWQSKPLFQLRSMAQTRACAKALRNVLSWVVVLAGYRPTPAEEMMEDTVKPTVKPPQQKAPAPQSAGEPPLIPNDRIRYLLDVQEAEGVNKETKKPWKRYDCYFEGDQNKYSTFSESLAMVAAAALRDGDGVLVDVKSTQSGKYTNWTLEHIEIVPDSKRKAAEPEKEAAPF